MIVAQLSPQVQQIWQSSANKAAFWCKTQINFSHSPPIPPNTHTHRAAASRCRAKKKHWVDSLEKKAKELEVVNQALQQEVLMLRSEVQQLKSILIAHKDCPLIVHRTSKTGEWALIGTSCLVQCALIRIVVQLNSHC